MLCNKDRMPFHRRLFPIIFRERRSQSGRDEIYGVGTESIDSLGLDVLTVLARQFEPGPALFALGR